MVGNSWDREVDVVVVGSGAASVCAALIAKDHGFEPLIVEKLDAFGGTTAWSGGAMWIPDNPLMERDGQPDSYDRSMAYLEAAVWHDGPAATRERLAAFVREGRRAISYLESKGMAFKRATDWPDYHSDLVGGEQTSRNIVTKLFDINELGEWKSKLSLSPLPTFRFTMDEMSKLLLVKRTWKSRAFALRFAGRLLWQKILGKDRRGGGAALQGRLLKIAIENDIAIQFSTRVTGFVMDGARVAGITAEQGGRQIRIGARRGVLLNAGGFARNAEMRERYGRQPAFPQTTNANLGDTGDMIRAGMALGAATDCLDEAIWGLSSLAPDGSFPERAVTKDGTAIPFGHHFDISLPHMILVDQDGERFGNEAGSYMELGQRLYARHAQGGRGIPAWAIIESRHRDRYVWGTVLGATPQSWFDSGYMKRASSLEELAQKCGIDPERLRNTVERFNGFCRAGVDEDFGRGGKQFDRSHGDPTVRPNPSLGPIEQAPFYAVSIVPGDVSTWGGLVTDAHARVVDANGEVIAGLYAAGTTTASAFGRTYPGGGASIGSAVTFGFIAARHMVGAN